MINVNEISRNQMYCGDLHGDKEFFDWVVKTYSGSHWLVFLGDVLDSFEFHIKSQHYIFEKILADTLGGKYDFIIGNHELSYLYRHLKASGWTHQTSKFINSFTLDSEQWLKPFKTHKYYPDNKLLITHAGLTKSIWDEKELNFYTLAEELKVAELSSTSWLCDIGSCRGGLAKVGGIFWCDWNEEFEHIPELNQVFGHTVVRNIESIGNSLVGNSYNIDCLQHTYQLLELDIQTNKLNVINCRR